MRGLFLTSLAFAAATPAMAQHQTMGDEIVVQGTVHRQKQIRDFVKELTPARSGMQLGRFVQPVCPRSVGLPAQANALVEARIRKVAAAVGAPVAGPKCSINLYVLVGADKRETIQGIRNHFRDLVAGVPDFLLKQLEAAPGPVAAWQIVGRVGTDGMPLTTVVNSQGDSMPMASTIGWASRIGNITRPQFLGSILVVESKALNRVDTRQLADYAVMRTLAPTDMTHELALPEQSIIQLFDDGMSPDNAAQSVTSWDFAYLKALYSTSNDVNATQQRSEMARKMAKELQLTPEGDR